MASYRFIGPLLVMGNVNQQTGTAIAAGDIDGDGQTDFILGSSVDRDFGQGTSLYILSGASLAQADAADGITDSSIDLDLATGVSGVYRIDNMGDDTDFGQSLAIGDFDGDARVDLIVGASGTDIGGTNFGAAYLYFGQDLAALDLRDGASDGVILAQNASYTFLGDESNGLLGARVDALDVKFSNTGAGDEIVITAPYTNTGADVDEGSVWIVSSDDLGRLDGLDGAVDSQILLNDAAARPSPIDGTTLIDGDASGDRLGFDVADVGPVFQTASGFHQLLIGANGANGGAGRVYLVPGTALGVVDLADTVVDGRLQGEFLGTAGGGYVFSGIGTPREEGIGFGLGTPGDIDGDGRNDLLIGGTLSDVAQPNGGAAYLIRAAGLETLDQIDGEDFRIDLALLNGQTQGGAPAAYRFIGDVRNGGLGRTVDTAGDIDGDGTPDLLLTAPDSGDGLVYLVSTAALAGADAADGTVDGEILMANTIGREGSYQIAGSGARSQLGEAAQAIGDVDGDGMGDFFLGDPLLDPGGFQNRGGGHLVSGVDLAVMDGQDGSQDGRVSLDFLLDQQTGATFAGTARDDLLRGRNGNDSISGLAGHDTLRGEGGDDTLIGGAGNDVFHDGLGDDLVQGGDGDDTWYADSGTDRFEGGAGSDTVVIDLRARTPQNFVVELDFETGDSGARGIATLRDSYSDVENFTLLGDYDADALGSADGNRLSTDLGDDTLVGRGGNDTLSGGAGDDLIYGDLREVSLLGDAGPVVYRVYQATLDRTPDRAGFLDWSERLFDGAIDQTSLVGGFIASPEFQTVYGALSDSEFVELLYQNILGRPSDAGGLAHWTGQLGNGTSRESVVLGFSNSPEFVNATAGPAQTFIFNANPANWADEVYRLYQTTLDRDPDTGGFANWTGALANGTALATVVAGFVNSPEFQNTYGALSNPGFVELLYQNVLGRAADAGGLANWVGQLDSGTARAQVVLGFSESPEFVNGTKAALTSWMRAQGGDRIEAGPGNDTVAGGIGADVFVFAAGQPGTNSVLDLERWDQIELSGFGYSTVAEARAHLSQNGADVRFADQSVIVDLENRTLSDIADDMILI